MDNVKNDKYYAAKAIADIDTIKRYLADKSYDEFVSNEQLIDSIMFRLIQIVENIKNITQEFKESHSNIPWGKIIGFRNGIVHEYGKTDYSIVYEVITQDIEVLKELLNNIQ